MVVVRLQRLVNALGNEDWLRGTLEQTFLQAVQESLQVPSFLPSKIKLPDPSNLLRQGSGGRGGVESIVHSDSQAT